MQKRKKSIFAIVDITAISTQVLSSILWSKRAIYVPIEQALYFLNKGKVLLNNAMNNYGERI